MGRGARRGGVGRLDGWRSEAKPVENLLRFFRATIPSATRRSVLVASPLGERRRKCGGGRPRGGRGGGVPEAVFGWMARGAPWLGTVRSAPRGRRRREARASPDKGAGRGRGERPCSLAGSWSEGEGPARRSGATAEGRGASARPSSRRRVTRGRDPPLVRDIAVGARRGRLAPRAPAPGRARRAPPDRAPDIKKRRSRLAAKKRGVRARRASRGAPSRRRGRARRDRRRPKPPPREPRAWQQPTSCPSRYGESRARPIQCPPRTDWLAAWIFSAVEFPSHLRWPVQYPHSSIHV